MKLTAVLAKPAPAEASWRVLCSHRSNFESGGVVVGRPAATAGWFEAVINRGGAVRDIVAVVATSCPRALQKHRDVVTVPGVCGRGGDGRTGLTVTGKAAPAGLMSQRGPA
jgi:hypothetical protein